MKKIFICLAILLSVTGCRTFNVNQAIKAPDRNYEQKLPTLEPVFENENEVKHWTPGEKVVRENSHFATLFYREVEKNLSDPYGKQKGYIVLRPIMHTTADTQAGWLILSMCSGTLLNWAGVPFMSTRSFYELEMEVLNNKGELIKKYSAEATDKEYVAVWWGYGNALAAQNAARYTSYQKALGNLVEQVMDDKEYIIKKLK